MKQNRSFFQWWTWMAMLAALAAAILWFERPTGGIRGRVLDVQGSPLAKATVVIDAYPLKLKAKTDAEGKFTLSLIPVGQYYLQTNLKGYESYYTSTQINVTEGKVWDAGIVTLKEREPSFSMEMWDSTKTPEDKVALTLSSTKVKEIHFTAYQIDLVEYLKQAGSFTDLDNRDSKLPDILARPGVQRFREWSETLPAADIPEWSKALKVDLPPQGFFLIHAVASTADRSQTFQQHLWVNRTNLGFIVKADAERLQIYPKAFVPGATESAPELFSFQSPGKFQRFALEGAAPFSIPQEKIERESKDALPFLLLKQGGNFAFLPMPRLGFEGEGEEVAEEASEDAEGEEGAAPAPKGDPQVFLYTERPLYRPGQKVYFKGIARHLNSAGNYLLPNAQTATVTVTDPQGDILFEKEAAANAQGAFWADFDLSDEAALGYYRIAVEFAGKEFSQDFEVDAYRKPEFKIEILPEKPAYFSGDKIRFGVDAQYYFGAPLQTELEYTLYKSPYYAEFEGEDWEEPLHYNMEASFGGYGEVVADGKVKTDASGHASLDFDAPKDPQDQRLTLRVTAKDVSERLVTQENDAFVYAGDFVFRTQKSSFLARPSEPFSLQVLTRKRDRDAQPGQAFTLTVEKEIWQPISGSYQYRKAQQLKASTDASGSARMELKFPGGGYYRLTLKGEDAQKRKVEYADYVWVAGSSEEGEDYGIAENLLIIADRKKLSPGEKLKVLIVSPQKDQEVWMTVEGAKIHRSWVEKLNGFSKEIEIPMERDWLPNVFVKASTIAKKQMWEATQEVAISPAEHFLKIEVASDRAKYEPGEEVKLQVKTLNAENQPVPADVSIGVVDESLYALKADGTDIQKFFWGPRGNAVASNYSFSGYYSGGIEKEDQKMLRRNFKDTAFWLPSVATNEQGLAEVKFNLPDNLTTWRTTVLGQTPNTEVGQQIQKFLVTKDVVARLAVPRFFRERDEVVLKAILQNLSGERQDFRVGLNFSGLELVDAKQAERTLSLAPQETASFEIPVKALRAGEAKLQLFAKGKQSSDGFELKIPVLPYGIEDKKFFQGELASGTVQRLELPVPPGARDGLKRIRVIADTSIVGQLLGTLNYLLEYPYGCVEQTTSRLMASLRVSELYQSLKVVDEKLEKRVQYNVKRGLKRILSFQKPEGWGWWQHDPVHPYMTGYALYGLLQAKAAGWEVKEESLEQGKKALQDFLNTTSATGASVTETQAYFLQYVASLAGLKDLAASRPNPTQKISQAYWALAQHRQGHSVEAKQQLDALLATALCENQICHFEEKGDPYSKVELTAWVLKAVGAIAPENTALQKSLVDWLLAQRRGGYWRQTRESYAVLDALTDYVRREAQTQGGVQARLILNEQDLDAVQEDVPHWEKDYADVKLSEGNHSLDLKNEGAVPLQYQVEYDYFTQEAVLNATEQGIRVQREYFFLDQEKVEGAPNPTLRLRKLSGKIPKGTWVGVRLTVTTNRDLEYLLLEEPLPAGFEVIRDVTFDSDAIAYSQAEVYDEHAAFFLTVLGQGKRVFNYVLRPELTGKFQVMPTQAYEMYRPETRGSSESSVLEVK